MQIRTAAPDDAPAISALVSALSGYFLADPDRPEEAAAFFRTITPESIAGFIEGGRFVYHVAEERGELAGAIGVRDGSHLYHLFVDDRFHRRGIATRLWEHALAEAGYPARFTVNASLFAVPLYERLGFTAAGEAVVKDGIAFQPMVLAG